VAKNTKPEQGKARTVLANMSSFFYKNWKLSSAIFGGLILAGFLSYTVLLKRDGFPSIEFPLTVVSGTYFVNDKAVVDADVTAPLSQALAELETVDSVSSSAGDNFFNVTVFFDSELTSDEGTEIVKEVYDELSIPKQVQVEFTPINPSGYLNEYDLLVSVYSTNKDVSPSELELEAQKVADAIADDEDIDRAEPQNLITSAQDPVTGQTTDRQTAFNLIGLNGESLEFYPSITLGVDRAGGLDFIELSASVNEAIDSLDRSQLNEDTQVVIGAEQGDSINNQIASLESNLLTGISAVAIISLLLISWRASIITAIFMVSVVVVSTFVLLLIGSTLNTITLFGLILALGLFVDDATIIVEAIDTARSGKGKAIDLLRRAISRVALASFAGTITTVLVFLPLAFITGILGEFIRILPITVIIALITSLVLSLTLIPFLSRFAILTEKNLRTDKTVRNPILKAERYIAGGIGDILRWMGEKSWRGRVSVAMAVGFSFVMIFGAGLAVQQLEFNIFPSSKDADHLLVSIDYAPGETIESAQTKAKEANNAIADSIGEFTEKVIYGGFAQPNERRADAVVELTPFTERETASPQLIARLETALAEVEGISTTITQLDAGPPSEDFPFKVQIFGDDEGASTLLVNDIVEFVTNTEFERANGESFSITETKIDGSNILLRQEGRRLIQLSAGFDADDVSALVTATQEAVEAEFDSSELESRGLESDTLGFDFGQESDNAESFAALRLVFPISLVAMFVVLGVQFKSAIQPLLIFMAIPFSLFGVFAGLNITDNPLSFFSMVGLIGLIGIAVNNTILLVDYANQERLNGEGIVESIARASEKRFRPLLATTLTTIAALLPLALADPFWEALAYTIIFGLASSTLLVVIAFPYYYAGVEKLRVSTKLLYTKLRRKGL